MTFREKRAKLRMFRRIAPILRARVNSRGFHDLDDFVLDVSPDNYEALEFGLSTLKVWLPELDDEQEIIKGSGRLVRVNMLYRQSNEFREHLLFKGIRVFRDETATPL